MNTLKVVLAVTKCKSSFVNAQYTITNAVESCKPPRIVYLQNRSLLFCIFHLPRSSFIVDTNLCIKYCSAKGILHRSGDSCQ
jgi:hypothetical protein